ncbi:hypothetical protein COV18_04600 [Candidatus Woesearchaeota archaeon CG10_big_fil_rev_8_21_14_0_10_37_12]|nr:MAG: hypothetical protein COV18_04600 [Candidatus Woesearchaeota archaeon CG10_big_fil_rev_8_21_14_0_10_37_12]
MVQAMVGPSWFLGVDASLEALAGIIALAVAFAAFHMYSLTKERRYAFLTSSFALMTASFISRAVTDVLLANKEVSLSAAMAKNVFILGYVTHILLALLAYVLLIILTYRLPDKRLWVLLVLILMPSLLLSSSYFLSFYGLSVILLGFVSLAFYDNYVNNRSCAAGMVFLAFALLTLSQIQFLLGPLKDLLYVSAHATQAAGFLMLFFVLVKVKLRPKDIARDEKLDVKKGKKRSK